MQEILIELLQTLGEEDVKKLCDRCLLGDADIETVMNVLDFSEDA